MSGYLHDWVASGELDIAITFNEQDTETVISKPLMREEMMLIGATEAMRDIPEPFPFDRIAELPLIVTGRKLNIRFEIDAGHQLVRLVSSGEGYGIFARSAFVDELAAGRVRAVPLEPGYLRTICLSYHRRKAADPVTAKVIEEIERLTTQIASTDGWPTA